MNVEGIAAHIDEKVYVALDMCRTSITGNAEVKGKRASIDFVIKKERIKSCALKLMNMLMSLTLHFAN